MKQCLLSENLAVSKRRSRSPASAQRDNWTDRGRARVSCQPGRWLSGLGPAGRTQDTHTSPPGLGSGAEPVPVFFTKGTHARSLCTTPHLCAHRPGGHCPSLTGQVRTDCAMDTQGDSFHKVHHCSAHAASGSPAPRLGQRPHVPILSPVGLTED